MVYELRIRYCKIICTTLEQVKQTIHDLDVTTGTCIVRIDDKIERFNIEDIVK